MTVFNVVEFLRIGDLFAPNILGSFSSEEMAKQCIFNAAQKYAKDYATFIAKSKKNIVIANYAYWHCESEVEGVQFDLQIQIWAKIMDAE